MIDISPSFHLDISPRVSLEELVKNPQKHYWQIHFKFPNNEYRNPYATNTGKRYGSAKSFAYIYSKLRYRFIDMYFNTDYRYSDVKEEGDALLQGFRETIGIDIDRIKTQEDEVYNISRNIDINKVRYDRASERYESYREEYDSYNDYLDDLASDIKLTRKGGYDKRTKEYRAYINALEHKDTMIDELYRLQQRQSVESNRYYNSLERQEKAVKMLRDIRDGTAENIKSDYHRLAEEFAERVKDDIITKAMNGILPTQSIPLKPSTKRKRIKAGLDVVPRFWATGQLVRSIIITCTLI